MSTPLLLYTVLAYHLTVLSLSSAHFASTVHCGDFSKHITKMFGTMHPRCVCLPLCNLKSKVGGAEKQPEVWI